MSNFFLNISWVSFMFTESGNHKSSALRKRKQQTLSPQISARAFKVWHSQLRAQCRGPQSTSTCWPRMQIPFCKKKEKKKKKNSTQACLELLKTLWGWERKRWIFRRDCLGKAPVNHSPGRMVGWREGDWMAVAFCAHAGTQTCSLFQPWQQCQQDKVLSYPPNQLS